MAKRPPARKASKKTRRTKASQTADDGKSGSASKPAGQLSNRTSLPMEQSTIPRALDDDVRRKALGLPPADQAGDYMVELNLMHQGGLEGARKRFEELCAEIGAQKSPLKISKSYYSWSVTLNDLRRLVKLDQDKDNAKTDQTKLAVYSLPKWKSGYKLRHIVVPYTL
jgi:hypothetical protein